MLLLTRHDKVNLINGYAMSGVANLINGYAMSSVAFVFGGHVASGAFTPPDHGIHDQAAPQAAGE